MKLRVVFSLALLFFHLHLSSGNAVYHVKQQEDAKNIALTFDDGPHQILSPKLLDALKTRAAKVTFFVMVSSIFTP